MSSPVLSRRDTLMLIASLTGCGIAGTVPARASANMTTLGSVAAEAGLLYGTSIAQDTLDNPAQAELYAQEARLLVADWAMKLDVLKPDADSFNSVYADALVDYASAAGLPLRGTALAWNESRPDWLMALGKKDMAIALDRYIDETAGYFAGKLQSWDVVNEPFWPGHGLEGGYRDGPWYQAFGPDYCVRAFKRAAEVDPSAKLVLNEAATEQWTDDGAAIRAGLLRLVDELQDAGVRLDAVGLQGHLQPQLAYDDKGFADFLWELSSRKVEIWITELDVNDSSYPDDALIRDAAVADRYENFLKSVLAVPAVTTVITWQLSDNATWYRDLWRQTHPTGTTLPRPLPFDAGLQKKPAYDAMIAAFKSRQPV